MAKKKCTKWSSTKSKETLLGNNEVLETQNTVSVKTIMWFKIILRIMCFDRKRNINLGLLR